MKALAIVLPLLLVQQVAIYQCHAEPQQEGDVHPVFRPTSPRSQLRLRLFQSFLKSLGFNLPFDLNGSTLSYMCSTIMSYRIIQSRFVPDMSALNFVLHTDACNNVSVPLAQSTSLLETPGFSKNRPTVLFITGWRSTINKTYSTPVAKAFACRDDYNFLVLDTSTYIDTLYAWSALNTESIGRYVAKSLIKLDRNYVTRQLHVIGHSLGAQIAGATGRYYRQLTGRSLRRVTGLDPANPCFYDGNDLPGIRSGDASYVDIIHTNPGMLGTAAQVGDADFYVEGLNPINSGCTGITGFICSHNRAVDYLVESVYPTNMEHFTSRTCNDYGDLKSGRRCSRLNTALMGFTANKRGLFYVDINPREAFGINSNPKTFTPTNSTCGACDA